MSRLGGLVVSASLTIVWAWSSSELADVTGGLLSTNNESLLSIVSWGHLSGSVSVSLSVSNVEGEEIELTVEVSQVVDLIVEVCNASVDVDSLEPVESHGVKNLIDGL